MSCTKAPTGWRCTREAGHDGPCASWPKSLKMRLRWGIRLRSLSIMFNRR